jgi:3',5'-cyclic AMP phosphodiesterase CpdA
MTLIVHLSDLHFGDHDAVIVERIHERVLESHPGVVAVSGDLTQRARRHEFAAARRFLDDIAARGIAVVAVPGNHDVPLWNPLARSLWPYRRFSRMVDDRSIPYFQDHAVALAGLNSARRARFAAGRIRRRDGTALRTAFAQATGGQVRAVLVHHAPGMARHGAVADPGESQQRQMRDLGFAGVRLVLAGHHHRSGAVTMAVAGGFPVVVVQAGTAASSRLRGEVHSFNLVTVRPGEIEVAVQRLADGRFGTASVTVCPLTPGAG